MKRGDRVMFGIFAFLVAAGACVLAWRAFAPRSELTAVVISGGRTVRRIKLSGAAPETFAVKYGAGWNLITVKDGMIAVTGADCPDRECVKRGWLTKPGESAVCLPHRLVVRIEGGEPAVDGTAY